MGCKSSSAKPEYRYSPSSDSDSDFGGNTRGGKTTPIEKCHDFPELGAKTFIQLQKDADPLARALAKKYTETAQEQRTKGFTSYTMDSSVGIPSSLVPKEADHVAYLFTEWVEQNCSENGMVGSSKVLGTEPGKVVCWARARGGGLNLTLTITVTYEVYDPEAAGGAERRYAALLAEGCNAEFFEARVSEKVTVYNKYQEKDVERNRYGNCNNLADSLAQVIAMLTEDHNKQFGNDDVGYFANNADKEKDPYTLIDCEKDLVAFQHYAHKKLDRHRVVKLDKLSWTLGSVQMMKMHRVLVTIKVSSRKGRGEILVGLRGDFFGSDENFNDEVAAYEDFKNKHNAE